MTTMKCEEIKELVSKHGIDDVMNSENQIYRIGKHVALILITHDSNNNVLSACCKVGSKCEFFTDPNDASYISDVCEKKYSEKKSIRKENAVKKAKKVKEIKTSLQTQPRHR